MDKRIVTAVAGAGKTYYVANDFKISERVVLISFTNSNVNNIRQEIHKRFKSPIPDNIQIMTYDSFIYNNLIKPIEPLLFHTSNRKTGVDLITIPEEDPRKPNYKKVNKWAHYMNSNYHYYVSRMSKLFLRFPDNIKNVAMSRVEKYCDAIYFDEFQDYNGYDFRLLQYFLEETNLKVVAVGDIYQSCLTPLRNNGNRIAKSPFYLIDTVNDPKEKLSRDILFDQSTLKKSRRVPKLVCEMIQDKMGIPIDSISDVDASVQYLDNIEDINNVVTNPNIPNLIWNKSAVHHKGKNYVNWTYSKGDTYSVSCITLTENTSNSNGWVNIKAPKTKNALYVALTRSEGDIYLITAQNYKRWCKFIDDN